MKTALIVIVLAIVATSCAPACTTAAKSGRTPKEVAKHNTQIHSGHRGNLVATYK